MSDKFTGYWLESAREKARVAERERCAQEAQSYITLNTGDLTLAKLCADAIRNYDKRETMTRPTTVFDRCLEQFKRDMRWSPQASETEKALVLGNLNSFTAILNRTLMETSDSEILAAVSSNDLLDAKNIKNAALVRAADCIKSLDGGNQQSKTGWKSEELLDVWMQVRSALGK